MVVEIATLKLISDLILAIGGEFTKLRRPPKKRFVQELISLFKLLERVQQNISDIKSSLNNFKKERLDPGLQVKYLQIANDSLYQFSKTCEDFIKLVDELDLTDAFEILAPGTKQRLNQLIDSDRTYIRSAPALRKMDQAINALKEDLQATSSPNPQKLPTAQFVSEAIEGFNQISLQIDDLKRMIRKFASANLRVEDFF